MESRLILKNIKYNKYQDIFLFISRNNFKKYRKKVIIINPRDYQYYGINSFSKKSLIDIEIDDIYEKLYLFLYKFSDKYAYNKFSKKPYINNAHIEKYGLNPFIKTKLELYTWL